MDENKENIHDDKKKDSYSNMTLMVRVDDPKSVIDSLAKILGIDETLIMFEYAKRKEDFDDEELKTMKAVSLDDVLPMELEDNDMEEKEVAKIFEKENNNNVPEKDIIPISSEEDQEDDSEELNIS